MSKVIVYMYMVAHLNGRFGEVRLESVGLLGSVEGEVVGLDR